MSDSDLLRTAIKVSGLSARRYAREILLRDEKTIARWLSGESPVPDAVIAFLQRPPQIKAEV